MLHLWRLCRRCCAGPHPSATTLDRCRACGSGDLVPLGSHEGRRILAEVDARRAVDAEEVTS
jgi:ribosomal protein L40E